MEISIKSNKNRFRITVEGKYNFISGDSATKKTLFNTLAILAGKSNRSVKMKVVDGNRILTKDEIHVFGNGTGNVDVSILSKYTGHLL